MADSSIFLEGLPNTSSTAYNGAVPSSSLTTYVGSLVSALFGILGIVFFGLLVYAGFLWMTAQGDPKKVEKAQSIMRESIIGLVIMLTAYVVSLFVVKALQGL